MPARLVETRVDAAEAARIDAFIRVTNGTSKRAQSDAIRALLRLGLDAAAQPRSRTTQQDCSCRARVHPRAHHERHAHSTSVPCLFLNWMVSSGDCNSRAANPSASASLK